MTGITMAMIVIELQKVAVTMATARLERMNGYF